MNENQVEELYQRAVATGPGSATLHVRVMGRSRDISLTQLNLQSYASDETIRQELARFMEVPIERLKDTFIERHENGNITVRPEAVFG
jgi:hypothetical protein